MRREEREFIGGIWLKRSEHKLLRLAREGLSNREIANEMMLSIYTVKKYFSELLAKLGAKNRIQAVAWFIEVIRKTTGKDVDEAQGDDEVATAEMSPSELVVFATEWARRIYQVRVQGNPQKAFEMVEELAAWVRSVSRKAPSLSQRLRNRLGRMLLR